MVGLVMAYHLSVVEIREEINQQDMPPSPNPHTPQMTITPPAGAGRQNWLTSNTLRYVLLGTLTLDR
ncbi:hypothetical protein, partial [Salmonella enterica]|uniref:hypothetical protein n=1 Tax=Salmonella enterica TaxID=28901 RepID=UPI001BAEDE67